MWFRGPKHTVGSAARTLLAGLDAGTIVPDSTLLVPAASIQSPDVAGCPLPEREDVASGGRLGSEECNRLGLPAGLVAVLPAVKSVKLGYSHDDHQLFSNPVNSRPDSNLYHVKNKINFISIMKLIGGYIWLPAAFIVSRFKNAIEVFCGHEELIIRAKAEKVRAEAENIRAQAVEADKVNAEANRVRADEVARMLKLLGVQWSIIVTEDGVLKIVVVKDEPPKPQLPHCKDDNSPPE